MPRKGENIRKRKDGRWEGRYIKGYALETNRAMYVSIYGKTYSEVKLKLNEAKYRITNGQQYIDNSRKRFGEVLSYWLTLQKGILKPPSYAKYKNLIKNHIMPQLGHVPIKELTPIMVTSFLQDKSEPGKDDEQKKGLSPSTIQSMQYILNAAISYAGELQLMTPFTIRNIAKTKGMPWVEILTKQEEARLDEYLTKHFDSKNIGIILGLNCGLRIGEVCALRWEDINFENNTLRIERTVQRLQRESTGDEPRTILHVGTPKSISSYREILMPEFLAPRLRELSNTMTKQYILTGSEHSPMDPRTYQYYFRNILKKLEIRQVKFHVLRHTFATNCVALGFDIKTLSEILGHSNITITLNCYVHPTDQQKQKQMNYWNTIKGHIYGKNEDINLII